MKALRRLRIAKAEDTEVGPYTFGCIVSSDGRLQEVRRIEYLDHPLDLEEVSIKSLYRAIQSWLDTVDPFTRTEYSDQHLVNELDSVRKYPLVNMPGWYVCWDSSVGKGMRLVTEDDFHKMILVRPELGQESSEMSQYFSNGGNFKVQPSIAWTEAKKNGGVIYKVRMIYANPDAAAEAGHLVGYPYDARGCRLPFQMLIRGETGIPVIDELFPLGASTTSAADMNFFFADGKAMDSLWIKNYLIYDRVWPEGEKNWELKPDEESFHDEERKIMFTPPSEKLYRLQSPKTLKKLLMPGKMSEYDNVVLYGPVYDLPEYDGIVAFMSDTKFRSMCKTCGFDIDAKAIKVISPFAKGLLRAIPDEEFYKHFPISATDFSCVFIKKSSDYDRVAMRYACTNEECNNYGLTTPATDTAHPVCTECGMEMAGPEEEYVGICPNSQCVSYGRATHSQVCKSCGQEPVYYPLGIMLGKNLGQHNSDMRKGRPHGRTSHQIVLRGAVKKPFMAKQLIQQLTEYHQLAAKAWLSPNEPHSSYTIIEGEALKDSSTVVERLKTLMNIKVHQGGKTYEGANALLAAGVYPCNPRVVGRVAELLAGLILQGKQSVILPAKRLHGKFISYASPYAVPGLDLEESQIRIPKYLMPLTAVKNGKRIVTLLRYPIRPGGTDMRTMEVIGTAHGNVVEVHPKPWAAMEGDFDGDTAGLLPVWVTGICKQTKCSNPVSERTEEPKSVEDVISLTFSSYEGKHSIGPVDVKNSAIVTEFECQGEPITEEEGLHIRMVQQNAIGSFKHKLNKLVDAPTERLKKILSDPKPPFNPVNAVLYCRPWASAVHKDIRDFCHKNGIPIPAYKFNNLKWLKILQRYGNYVLTQWPLENPSLAYRVYNHPYLSVLKAFVDVNINHLVRVGTLNWQYEKTFQLVYATAMNELREKYPEFHNAASKIIEFMTVESQKYTNAVASYSLCQADPLMSATAVKWKDVTDVAKQIHMDVDRKIREVCLSATSGAPDEYLIAMMRRAVWAYAGTKDSKCAPSFIYHVDEIGLLSKVFSIYNHLNQSGLDSTSVGLIKNYFATLQLR